VLLADTQAEVYTALHGHGADREVVAYGCVHGHKHAYALGAYNPECLSGAFGGCASVEQLVLAGPIVAYGEAFGDEHESSYRVFVRDLRTGRILHNVPTGTPNTPSRSMVGVGPATVIVVKNDGAVAWIAQSRPRTEPPAEYEVHALDSTGSRVLAAGPGVDPSSLALAGNTLYWTEGGKPASTVLH